MKTVSMSGTLRAGVGKKDAKKLRADGLVPCVIYGGKEQVHFSMDEREFNTILFTPEVYFIDIKIGDTTTQVILQEIQYHPVSDKVLHADFLELSDDKEIKLGIPIKLKGNSKGVLKGGRMVKPLRKLILKSLPADMPEDIEVDITNLDINDSVKIKDLTIDKVEILNPPNSLVVAIKTARAVTDDEEEEEEGEEESGEEGGEEKPEEGSQE